MLTASDAGGTSPVAVNPVGYEEAEVRKFSQRLFVLSASVKQASGALAPVQAQTLRDSRLDLLRRVEGFASGEADNLKPLIKSGLLGLAATALQVLLQLQAQAGNEGKWQKESVEVLGTRLQHVHRLVEAGFASVMGVMTSADAEAAVALYSSDVCQNSKGKAPMSAAEANALFTQTQTHCLSTSLVTLTPPQGTLAATTRSSTGSRSFATSHGRSSIRCRASWCSSPRPRRLDKEGPFWEGVFELVDSNLVQFLDRKAAAKTRLTCSTWRQSLDSAQVSAAPYGSIKPTRLVSLFPNITSLNLEHALAEQLLPDHLLTLTKAYGDQLLTLRLSHCAVEAIHMPFFTCFRVLTRLDLSRCALLSRTDLAALPTFLGPALSSISVAHLSLDDSFLFRLESQVRIQEQPPAVGGGLHEEVRNNRTNKSLPKKITDTLQQAAPSVTGGIGVSLTELDLSGCRSITSPGVISLACSLRGLRVLRLRDCDKVCGVALASCCDHLTELRELDLRGLNDLTDTSLSSISCLVRLEWLGVGSKQAMGPWLSSLKHLPELRQLSLRGCNELTDIGFTSHFPVHQDSPGRLRKLESLDLAFCSHMGGRDLWAMLVKLPVLRELDLSYTNAGGSAMDARLPEMTSLTSLSLEGCGRITEKALDAIVSHPSLRHLNVRGCSCFGYYGVIALEASDIDFLM